MARPLLLATFEIDAAGRASVAEALGGAADALFLTDLAPADRAAALARADVLLARNTARELKPGELALIGKARLVQFVSAGVDFIPFADYPPGVKVATNRGAYAEPMAEHALALALAAAKRLLVEQANLARGAFNQFTPTRMLAGGVCGVFGFGGIGIATARLMRAMGLKIHAINRSGTSSEPVEWLGTPDRLDALLATADVLVIAAPLTRATDRLIRARELTLMKPDAILVNLARGEIVDEGDLYRHLAANPRFTACIDAWWIEPVRHGAFRMSYPFLDLPNVVASPHNSAQVRGWRDVALRRALANCRRVLEGGEPEHLLAVEDRLA